MAIYLDTNVMYGWRTFAELDRLALTILASELGQDVIVPSLVADELEGQMRRQLEEAAARFEAAGARVERLFDLDYVMTEPALNVDLPLARWRAALDDAFGSCEVTAGDALDGLRREIDGAPPARRSDPRSQALAAGTPPSGSLSPETTQTAKSPVTSSRAIKASGMGKG